MEKVIRIILLYFLRNLTLYSQHYCVVCPLEVRPARPNLYSQHHCVICPLGVRPARPNLYSQHHCVICPLGVRPARPNLYSQHHCVICPLGVRPARPNLYSQHHCVVCPLLESGQLGGLTCIHNTTVLYVLWCQASSVVEEVKSNWSGKNLGNSWPSHTH